MANRLQYETSPYLLQHAHNPVDWYAWGPEALLKAETENKLLIVSIGYAACHWCHVMERESFEDEEVAAFMNEHFVCIKVDREERPDLDKVYMDAVMALSGRGGWPLNAFALPDGRPVYGGTYYSKPQWLHVMRQLAALYRDKPEQALSSAHHLGESVMEVFTLPETTAPFTPADHLALLEKWLPQMDPLWGGRKSGSNKFPVPVNLRYLLRAGFLARNEESLNLALLTFQKMALGGIYDQLGGGFARYSVDKYWHVPHFEKMLYDNGQLVSAYAEAYRFRPSGLFKKVITETCDWVLREMESPEGGFYASLDADSEGVEGKFYVWTWEELQDALGADLHPFADYYQATAFGNWEGVNVLIAPEEEDAYALRWKLDPADFSRYLQVCRDKLMEIRAKRVRPGLDDKILTSWNALMARGFTDAYRVFKEEKYRDAARRNLCFLRDHLLTPEGQLFRNFKGGKRSIPGFLDDYACFIDACIGFYEVSFEVEWVETAKKMVNYVEAHFSHPAADLFFYTADTEPVVGVRKTETQDDVIPSSNAMMATNLFLLGLLYGNSAWLDRSQRMLQVMRNSLEESPSWHACWAQMALRFAFPHYEIVITGPDALPNRFAMEEPYYPNRLFAGSEKDENLPVVAQRVGEQAAFFVCEGGVCHLPADHVEAARSMIQNPFQAT
jgi:hypothetical protein